MKALILAGGSGHRFWPVSRRARPKQLLSLHGESSFLQATVARLEPLIAAESVWVVTTASLAAGVRRQLPAIAAGQVLGEPLGRNTLAAIVWALQSLPAASRDETIVVLPADHFVADARSFRAALERAAVAVAQDDRIMTLGVTPRWPETGYGYLELEEQHDAGGGPRRVVRFTEKPDQATAERFVAGGRHLWNAGIFLFRAGTLLCQLAVHRPAFSAQLEALAHCTGSQLAARYAELPAESIDTGLMERLKDLYTEPLDCGWSDLGSWDALADVLASDVSGNWTVGDTVALEARGNLLYAESGTVTVLGVEGLTVVRTADAVLVMPRGRAQQVRELVLELERGGREDLL